MKINIEEKRDVYEVTIDKWTLWIHKNGKRVNIWCHKTAFQNRKDTICAHFTRDGSLITIHSGTFKKISDEPLETIFPLLEKVEKKYIIWKLTK